MVAETLDGGPAPACHQTDGWTFAEAPAGEWVGGWVWFSVCVPVLVLAWRAWSPSPVTQKNKLTSADSQERRVNGARKSVPSPDDEAKHHEDQDDGPGHGHHGDDDDRVLLAGDDGCCWRTRGQTERGRGRWWMVTQKKNCIGGLGFDPLGSQVGSPRTTGSTDSTNAVFFSFWETPRGGRSFYF